MVLGGCAMGVSQWGLKDTWHYPEALLSNETARCLDSRDTKIYIYIHVVSLEYTLNYKGPILCDVKLDPNEKIVPKVKAGSSIHKMLPALTDDEIKSNMTE